MLTNVLIILAGLMVGTRATRIITADRVTEPLRERLLHRFGVEHRLVYFVHCTWCVGFWVALVTALLVWFTSPHEWPMSAWWGIPGLVATYSWLNGFVYRTVGEA